jgi:hypothetical protein
VAVLAKTPHPLSEDPEPQEALHEVERFAANVYLAERLIDGATKEQLADQLVVRQFQSDLSTRPCGIVRDPNNLLAQLWGLIAGAQSRLDDLFREVTRANRLLDE